ncbi:hypothetical protein BDV98DRAFT_212378 [Pterulicium gracile]|uniref:Uncharacterized protein n=1 Tax=Pterulicium gracile TaxID=1884261 RepID=A0A5C3QJA0_9AGAR|nr:hypothetical protein BDV98DRAFT_212378 [Pterula gracilis]
MGGEERTVLAAFNTDARRPQTPVALWMSSSRSRMLRFRSIADCATPRTSGGSSATDRMAVYGRSGAVRLLEAQVVRRPEVEASDSSVGVRERRFEGVRARG